MRLFENKDYEKDLAMAVYSLPADKFSILITGATGLIGSFLTDVLIYANEKCGRAYEIFAMGRSAGRMKERFPYAVEKRYFHIIEQDVCEKFKFEDCVDYIINAASNADPRSYALYPAETILSNVLGTQNTLEYARLKRSKKVLFTSTMEVYGNCIEAAAYTEESFGKIDFNSVRSGYPESKRTAELLCRSYAEEYGVSVVIARLGYIYGPTMLQTDNKVVAQFLRNIVRKEDIVLKSKGEQRRSYLYVADTVTAIFNILFYGKSGEAYNVASSDAEISIRDLADYMAELGGCDVVYAAPDKEEQKGFSKPQDNVLCDCKLKKLGWKAEYDVKAGIAQTIRILKCLR